MSAVGRHSILCKTAVLAFHIAVRSGLTNRESRHVGRYVDCLVLGVEVTQLVFNASLDIDVGDVVDERRQHQVTLFVSLASS